LKQQLLSELEEANGNQQGWIAEISGEPFICVVYLTAVTSSLRHQAGPQRRPGHFNLPIEPN
jgi:hypothetical protein